MSNHWLALIVVSVCAATDDSPRSAKAPDKRDSNVSVAARTATPHDLVVRALQDESSCDNSARSEKLRAAVELDPNYAPAHWQLGELMFDGLWLTPDAVSARVLEQPNRWSYEQQLGRTADTVEGHLNLARWCRSHNESDGERAQLLLAAALAPNDQRPRRLLGLKLHNGVWLSDRELADAPAQKADAARVYQSTKNRLLALTRDLASSDVARRDRAEAEVLDLRNSRTIPAIEDTLCRANESAASLAVRALSNMPEQAATWSLARQAIWSPWDSVTNRAIEELRTRDADTFLPDLIELLAPVNWESERWVRQPDGSVASIRASQSLQVSDVLIVRYSNPDVPFDFDKGGVVPNKLQSNIADGSSARAAVQSQVAKINSSAENRIHRVSRVLGLLTGADYGADQSGWRQWWAKQNDLYASLSEEPPVLLKRYLVTDVPRVFATMGLHSCFVAGTPVWTRRGLVAIDHIQVGDLVLSMHPETAELGYRPVMGRTIRPATQVRALEIEGERIGATMGHPFWVSGRGWVRVRELQPDDAIRLCGSVAPIRSISEGTDDIAYNLVVAEFNTYFVGAAKILVHDNSPIRHEFRTVPGLSEADRLAHE